MNTSAYVINTLRPVIAGYIPFGKHDLPRIERIFGIRRMFDVHFPTAASIYFKSSSERRPTTLDKRLYK